MQKIYNAGNISEAHIVSGMLQARGIPAYVGGHYLQGGIGELAAQDFAVVYVEDEDQDEAMAVINEYEQADKKPEPYNPKQPYPIHSKFPLIILVACIVLLVLMISLK